MKAIRNSASVIFESDWICPPILNKKSHPSHMVGMFKLAIFIEQTRLVPFLV